MTSGATAHPAAVISEMDALATREVTPAGSGLMRWRLWGVGRPLLLLHGASGAWTHWLRNIPALAGRFRLLVPDMPGFGDSDTPPEPHTADTLAALVASGLDRMAPSPAEIDIAGFSFGSIIAGLVAARLGRRVRTLALIGAGGLGFPLARTRPLVRIVPDMLPDAVRRVHAENLQILMIADAVKVDDLAVHIQMENVRRTRFKSGTIPDSDVLIRALPLVEARLVAIYGRRDAFVGEALPERRRALVSARPDAAFHVIDGAGHWAPYEAADEVNRVLLEALLESPGR
jgi:pimeloyl-ACP methyl ester carboxylesterase